MDETPTSKTPHASKNKYRRLMNRYQPTSREAWDSVQEALPEIDRAILRAIRYFKGATCWQVEQALNLSHQTVSAQITHMRDGGMLCDTGRRGLTGSGRNAIIWDLVLRMPQDKAQPSLF